MRILQRTIGRKDFPSLKRSFWTPITNSKGWNNDGIPTKESLHELGLDYVYEDFEKRGIYGDNGDTPSKETLAEKEKEM